MPSGESDSRRRDAEIRVSLLRSDHAELKELAQEHDRTLHDEVRHAIRLYLRAEREKRS